MLATNQLLERIWSEEWIKKLGDTKCKAQSIVNPKQVILKLNGRTIYLPSRVRMGIAEQVGRILRSQNKRMNCFYDCLKVLEIVGWKTSENQLIKLVNLNFRNKRNIPIYKRVMVEQILRLTRNWYSNYGIDIQTFSYCNIVKPRIKNFVFTYGPDNYRELKYEIKEQKIAYQIKLPITLHPEEKKDWQWIAGEITIPEKIQKKLNESLNQHPKKPDMIIRTLKGGVQHYFLSFPWKFSTKENTKRIAGRVLAVDLGIKKFATAVVCENKRQISKPIFLKINSRYYQKIERLYKHIDGINKQLSLNPMSNRKREERNRLYRKLNSIKKEFAHAGANLLFQYAKEWQCEKIILEDLRFIKPRKGRKLWSRQMNEWLRGRIPEIVKNKCQEEGLKLQKVNPWNTSSHCPRCASTKGQKVLGSNNRSPKNEGRWFYCPDCGFSVDRDFSATLNVYRASFIDYKKNKSLKDISPIPYMGIGNPSLNCSWRRSSNKPTTSQIVEVTGG